MKKIFHSIYPSIIWTGVIFWLLSMDTSKAEKIDFLKLIPQYDKLIHLGLFAVLSILLGYYIGNQKQGITPSLSSLIILVVSVYGMAMEFYQLYFTHRAFSWWDGVADAVGAAIGMFWVIKKPLLK